MPIKNVSITVVVITKNEKDNIDKCLGSVHGWANEIVVVDDESTDNTVKLAKKYTDKVFEKRMDVEGTHRNWAYAQASNEWVFSLDADEWLTEELKKEIAATIPDTEFHAFSMPLKTYFGDYWVQHSGWYPASKIRMFMKNRLRYEEVEVHPRPILDGEEGRLKGDIVHSGYPDFEHFIASLNRQTTLEATKWIKTGRKLTPGLAFWRTIDRFPRIYFRKKGYKNGFIGFMIAFFASLYQILSYAKYWEMTKGGKRLSVEKKDKGACEL